MTTRSNWSALGAALAARPRAAQAPTDRQLGRLVIAIAAIAAALAALAVYAVLPANAIQLPRQVTQSAETLMPQGWGFFTADPQAIYPQVYEQSRAGTWQARGGTLAVPSDLFGLNRSLRAEGTEIALLLQAVPARDWRSCGRLPARCLAAAPVAVHLANTSTLANLCGQLGFVRQQVLPWAWRGTGTVMPSQVLRAEVSCSPPN